MREAYRKNKYILLDELQARSNQEILLAFIWLDNILHTTVDVENKVCNLLQRIKERLETNKTDDILE